MAIPGGDLPHWSLSCARASAWMVRLPYGVQPGGVPAPAAAPSTRPKDCHSTASPATETHTPGHSPLDKEPRMQPRAQTLCATHVILLHFALNSA